MMKSKATGFLKRIIAVLASMAKAKTLALKSKTNALRNRLIILSLLRNKKILQMSSISQKLHSLMGKQDKKDDEECDDEMVNQSNKKTIVMYNHMPLSKPTNHTECLENADYEDHVNQDNYGYTYEEEDNNDDKYPDLTHTLFDSEDLDFENPGGSVIDLVKNSKKEGEEFKLEDEIDQVADLFIRRFYRQMRMQKQHSLKRVQEMIERSA